VGNQPYPGEDIYNMLYVDEYLQLTLYED
jgi:hypothetical protein